MACDADRGTSVRAANAERPMEVSSGGAGRRAKKILERYMLKFSKGGKAKLHEDDLGLLAGDTEDGQAEGFYVQAGESAEEGQS